MASEQTPLRSIDKRIQNHEQIGPYLRSDLQQRQGKYSYNISRGGVTVATASGSSPKAAGEDLTRVIGILAKRDAAQEAAVVAEKVDTAAAVASATKSAQEIYASAVGASTTTDDAADDAADTDDTTTKAKQGRNAGGSQ